MRPAVLPPASCPRQIKYARRALTFALVVTAFVVGASVSRADSNYSWRSAAVTRETLESRFAPPSGFERAAVAPGSFAAWLRGLALQAKDARVLLFDGNPKARQDVHAAVIDIDTGTSDLQQCADAVMRLHAEWLYGTGRQAGIVFNFTSGNAVAFARYAKGERPDESAKKWQKSADADASYVSFRKYMNLVFAYAGTASLEKELKAIDAADVQIGDVFIKGGFPGHAVIVADLTENKITRSKRFLLIQSFMPAQDMHVLKNPANTDGSPWYAPPTADLVTPEWTFAKGSLRRWP